MAFFQALRRRTRRDPTPTRWENATTLPTSVTLGYEAENWGIDRIALDGVQNHLPADAKGTRVAIEFLIDDNWIDWREREKARPAAIRFLDDGKGYSHELLTLLHSTKKNDKKAVGHFGEGLKLLSAACLREDVDLELRSREWRARPRSVRTRIDGETIDRLTYEMVGGERIDGSQTIFWRPTDKLIAYIKELDRKVLTLRRGFQPIQRTPDGVVLDRSGDLFARGMYITDELRQNLLFGYELDILPNRDRNHLRFHELREQLGKIWGTHSDIHAIKEFLKAAAESPIRCEKSDEISVLSNVTLGAKARKRWQRAFHEQYGDKAVLQTDLRLAALAVNLGHTPVVIGSEQLRRFLEDIDVPTDIGTLDMDDEALYHDEQFDPAHIRVSLQPTSLTLGYRTAAWGIPRIVMDAVANHMPQDAGGTDLWIEYLNEPLSKKGEPTWHRYTPRDTNLKEIKPTAVRIRDDGAGYQLDHLLLLHSTKGEESIGQFGEGLKMLSAACLRDGISIKFRSQNWVARPLATAVDLGGNTVQRLEYKTVEGVSTCIGSGTTFYHPTRRLLEEFDNLGKLVLKFQSDVQVLHQHEQDRILTLPWHSESIYVKGFLFQSERGNLSLVHSYDLHTNDIAPDRNIVQPQVLQDRIRNLLETCTNRDVIHKIISTAEHRHKAALEMMELRLQDPRVKEAWRASFVDAYGKNAVLPSSRPSCEYEAEHRGYRIIRLEENVMRTLRNAGVPCATEAAFQDYTDVTSIKSDSLTERERRTLASLADIDRALGITDPVRVQVYEPDFNAETPTPPGYWTSDGTIHLSRDLLQQPRALLRTYVHERGHNQTGEPDPADRFRDFFETHLAQRLEQEVAAGFIGSLPWEEHHDIARLQKQREAEHRQYASELENMKRAVERTRERNSDLTAALRRAQGERWYTRVIGSILTPIARRTEE